MDIYINYSNYIKEICDNNDLKDFKSNENYISILEHTTKELGEEYMKLLINNAKVIFHLLILDIYIIHF